jgi:alpha-galactosidase/6-phospho-beta-glucosidase family protein
MHIRIVREDGSSIIEAVVMHRPTVIYGNVRNTGLIDNLPDGCVEVACLVDQNGVQPCYFGSLPEQLAGLNRAHDGAYLDARCATQSGERSCMLCVDA